MNDQSGTIPNSNPNLEGLSQAELLTLRAELKNKPLKGEKLTLDELELLVAVYGQLRRRSSGPPAAKPKGKPAKQPETLDDIPV